MQREAGFIRPISLLIRYIDGFSDFSGRVVAWLTLLMMIITCLVVVLRYGFEMGSIALQESVTYMHCMVFMLGAAFCLQRDGHVRVDIFYRTLSPQKQGWVNALGSLIFLLPLSGFLIGISWDYVASSWQIHESSLQADGIPAVFLLKTLIPVMGVLLGLQALALTLRSLLQIMGDELHG